MKWYKTSEELPKLGSIVWVRKGTLLIAKKIAFGVR